MRLIKYVLIAIFAIVCLNHQMIAQDTLKVDKSNNKVFISGKPFYIHIVKRGQTLYRIAKAYGVSVQDIEKENFNIKAQGLSVGQPVKIPIIDSKPDTQKQDNLPRTHVVDSGETAYSIARKYHIALKDLYALNPGAKEAIYRGQKLFLPEQPDTTTVKVLQDNKFVYHIIKKGETLYSIAQTYGVKARSLKKGNPNINPDDLQPGQVIKIGREDVDFDAEKPDINRKKFHYHNVKPGETLYSIARQYEIEASDIRTHNPQLEERELLSGEYIKLPRDKIALDEKDEDQQEAEPGSYEKLMVSDTCNCPENDDRERLQVALMLPLYSYTNDTINHNRTYQKIYNRSRIFLDFYEGVLLALDDLRKKGIHVDLHVYDTENDTSKVKKIIRESLFPYFDFIIGPVYSKNLPIVVERARLFDIPVISPLSTESRFLADYVKGFQVSPTENILHTKTIATVRKFSADNFVVIKNGNRPEESFVKAFKDEFFKGKTMEEIEHLGYAEVTYYAGDEELNLDPFVDSLHNFVLVPSSDKAFVSDVVARLNTLSEDHHITLFGHPRMINYENIDIKFFHNLNTHIFNLNYINYESENVQDFVYNYRKFFEREPGKYAFYGYDISYFFMHAYQLFGEQFYCCFDRYYPGLLQMQFNFQQQKPGAGFINEKMLLLNFQRNFLLRPVTGLN